MEDTPAAGPEILEDPFVRQCSQVGIHRFSHQFLHNWCLHDLGAKTTTSDDTRFILPGCQRIGLDTRQGVHARARDVDPPAARGSAGLHTQYESGERIRVNHTALTNFRRRVGNRIKVELLIRKRQVWGRAEKPTTLVHRQR